MKLNLRLKIQLVISITYIFSSAAAIFISSKSLEKNAKEGLLEKPKVLLSQLEAASAYIATMGTILNITVLSLNNTLYG